MSKRTLKVTTLVTTIVAGLVIWLIVTKCKTAEIIPEPKTFPEPDQHLNNEIQKADSTYHSYMRLCDISKDSLRTKYRADLLERIRAGAARYGDTLRASEASFNTSKTKEQLPGK